MSSTERGSPDSAPWQRVHAVLLPDGTTPVELFIDPDGRIATTPGGPTHDVPGRYVLPGLVDAHCHLTFDLGGRGLVGAALVEAHLHAQLAAGVLAVRDVGVAPGARVSTLAGLPTIITAGEILAPPGGGYIPQLVVPTTEDKLVDAALRQLDAGATWVKILADEPGPGTNWFAPRRTYSPAALVRVARAVQTAGGRITAHVSSEVVTDLVAAGFDSVEHAPLATETDVAEMAARGIAWAPTLTTVAGVLEHVAANVPPAAAEARAWLASMRRSLARAAELDVTLLAGTDEHAHGSLAAEAERIADFCGDPTAAVRAASSGARTFLGLPGLEPGEPADFVTFDDDPRSTIGALSRPRAILLHGSSISSQA